MRNVYFVQIPISPDIWSGNIDPWKSIKKNMHDFPSCNDIIKKITSFDSNYSVEFQIIPIIAFS